MEKQTGITFDGSLMNEVRTIRAELQIDNPNEKITMTYVMKHLIALHKKSRNDAQEVVSHKENI